MHDRNLKAFSAHHDPNYVAIITAYHFYSTRQNICNKLPHSLSRLQSLIQPRLGRTTKSCIAPTDAHLTSDMTETWAHRMPIFRYKGKISSFLWTDKKTYQPHIGGYRGVEIEHPVLVQGNRNKMKTLTIDPTKDLPFNTI